MTGRFALAAAAALLLAAGLASGTVAAILASPLAILTAFLARSDDAADAPFLAGAAAAALCLCGALGVAAQLPAAGFAATATLLLLARLAYQTRPSRTSDASCGAPDDALHGAIGERAAGLFAIWLDELARCAWRLRFRWRAGESLVSMADGARELAARNDQVDGENGLVAFHPVPPLLEKPSLLPEGGGVVIRFESTLEPWSRDAAHGVEPASHSSADASMAHALLMRHDATEPRPTVVCIHALGGGAVGRETRRFDIEGLQRRGFDVALLTLPHHGARRERGRRRGPWAPGNPHAMSELVSQAVFDLRRLLGWLRRQGVPSVALFGEQIGGTVAALVAARDRHLAALVVRSTPASLADPWLAEIGERDRLALSAMGLSRAVLEDSFRSSAVLASEPRLPSDSLLIVAGARDRICTPEQTRALWEHWGRPALQWHPGGHLLGLATTRLHERVAEHLATRFAAAAEADSLPLTRFRA